jgi:SPP1 gp7 family putative phage head morphogenesis protein
VAFLFWQVILMPMDAALRKDEIWKPHRRTEQRYLGALQEIVDYLQQIIKNETDPLVIARILRNALNTDLFSRYCDQAASRMVTMLLHDGAQSWREAARKSSKGRIIYEALRRELQGPTGGEFYHQIARNAELIKTLPLDIAGHVTQYVARESLAGRRAEDIAGDIQKMFPANSRAKAKLIARTETSKTGAALTQARAEDIGIETYIWRTSEDERVRKSHKHMEDVIIFWNNPPSPERLIGEKNPPAPYNAGNIWNCRCYAEPIVDINRINFPHKVYINNQIIMLTRSRFLQLAA